MTALLVGLLVLLLYLLRGKPSAKAVVVNLYPIDPATGAPGYNSLVRDSIPPGQPIDPIDLYTGEITPHAQQPSCPVEYQLYWDVATNTYHCFPRGAS